jgi:putative addiction module component (TIGR02574 family)
MGDPREIESEALQLPPKERARLAQRLLASLDPASDRDAERVWLQEAERRLDELESGKIAGIRAGFQEGPFDASVRSVEFHPEAEAEFVSARSTLRATSSISVWTSSSRSGELPNGSSSSRRRQAGLRRL